MTTRFSSRPVRLAISAGAVLFAGFLGIVSTASTTNAASDGGFSAEDSQRVKAVTAPSADFAAAEAHERLSGGAGTFRGSADAKAMTHAESNLDDAENQNFRLGFALFKKMWAQAPSSTQASDGLGPLFNARSCQTCHLRDGRGVPPAEGAESPSFFFRLARPARNAGEQAQIASHDVLNFGDPVYGHQLQDKGVTGLPGEGRMTVQYDERVVTLAGGETVRLRVPRYGLDQLSFGPLDPATTLSPRISQSLAGMGLLEAIPEAELLAHADPDDSDPDGIAGRANYVRDPATGRIAIGRFGWKAQNATVKAQVASALSGDIGISSPLLPDPFGDCTTAETKCRMMPTGVQKRLGDTEAPDPVLDLLTTYTANLAVPARRNLDDPEVLAGKALFYRAGCAACHVPKFVTGRNAPEKQHAFQLIWPYSDLLLHDMGEGLADGQQVGEASGRDWRTAPLWGIGLTRTVNGHEAYLHDGRARTLEEAILWHGGEGERARDAYAGMERQDRQRLLKFLESL
jgi:CxxC motif-containing protein (DUF1111 family)